MPRLKVLSHCQPEIEVEHIHAELYHSTHFVCCSNSDRCKSYYVHAIFVVNTPDDMARMQLGVKYVTPEAIEKWKVERGYDKPLLFNGERMA